MFLKISQTSQESTCAGGLQSAGFLEETQTQVLSSEVCETLKNTYFNEHLRTAAPENVFLKLRKIKIHNEF